MLTSRDTLNRTGAIVGVGLVLMLGMTTLALVYINVPSANQNALLVLIGALSTNVTAVVAFFFGSSSTAQKSSETISTLADTAAIHAAVSKPDSPS